MNSIEYKTANGNYFVDYSPKTFFGIITDLINAEDVISVTYKDIEFKGSKIFIEEGVLVIVKD